MAVAIQVHAVAANAWLMGVLAFFHVTVMVLLGIAIWRATTYRAPLHEEFVGTLPKPAGRTEPSEAEAPDRVAPP